MADATFAHQTVTAFMCMVFWMEDNGWMASLKVGVAHWIACIIVTAPVVYNSTLGRHVQSQHAGDDGEQGHCTDADLAFLADDWCGCWSSHQSVCSFVNFAIMCVMM